MTVSWRLLLVGVSVALGASLPAAAQRGQVPRIGLLETGSLAARGPLWDAFREAMRELGYVEGQTVVFEARGADGDSKRLAAVAVAAAAKVGNTGPVVAVVTGANIDSDVFARVLTA